MSSVPSSDNSTKLPFLTDIPSRAEQFSQSRQIAPNEDTPAFIIQLETKKKFQLGHEQGAGNACLKCKDKCPGFDLHFWRKLCLHCKCGKAEHQVDDMDQFHRVTLPKLLVETPKWVRIPQGKDDVNPIEKKSLQDVASPMGKYEWVPPGASMELASAYMAGIPVANQPLKGSEGALLRKRQMELQVPPHDIIPSNQRSPTEKKSLETYVDNLKTHVLGQGEVQQLGYGNMEQTGKSQLNNWQVDPMGLTKLKELALQDPESRIPHLQLADFLPRDMEPPDFPPPPPPMSPPTSPLMSPLNSPPILPPPPPPEMFLYSQSDMEESRFHDKGALSANTGKESIISDIEALKKAEVFDCHECSIRLTSGEVAVFAHRAGRNVAWHPACFVCHHCKELLVDLIYFYAKDNVYCGRHFAQVMKIPRCKACDELVFSKEYTMAGGDTYHVDHFCCFSCDMPLAGLKYVEVEDQPRCLPCYHLHYGKTCGTCHQLISPDERRVGHGDLSWHATDDCFRCCHCTVTLVGKKFMQVNGAIFCSAKCISGLQKYNEILKLTGN